MKKFVTIVGVMLVICAAARPASASSILYFNDLAIGTDRMASALVAVSGSHTVTTATSVANFTTLLNTGAYQLGIFFQQGNTGADYDAAFTALGAQMAAGRAAIADDWSGTASHLALFGATLAAATNNTSVTLTAAGLMTGITNPVNLTNPGWGGFSAGMTAGGGATCGATFSDGNCAVIIRTGGRSFFNGMLSDTFSTGTQGVSLYVNEINSALASSAVPEPASLVLLSAGLLVGGRGLLRRKK